MLFTSLVCVFVAEIYPSISIPGAFPGQIWSKCPTVQLSNKRGSELQSTRSAKNEERCSADSWSARTYVRISLCLSVISVAISQVFIYRAELRTAHQHWNTVAISKQFVSECPKCIEWLFWSTNSQKSEVTQWPSSLTGKIQSRESPG